MNREPYNYFRRRITNRTRTLTTPIPTMTHPNMANRFHHFLHSMPQTSTIHHGNNHFTHHIYQATQAREHAHHTTLFIMTKASHEQQGSLHRGSPRLDGSLYGIFHRSTIMMAYTTLI